MAVRGVWHSRDGRLRVELRHDSGGEVLAVAETDEHVADFPTVQWLDAFLWEKYQLTFADLVVD